MAQQCLLIANLKVLSNSGATYLVFQNPRDHGVSQLQTMDSERAVQEALHDIPVRLISFDFVQSYALLELVVTVRR